MRKSDRKASEGRKGGGRRKEERKKTRDNGICKQGTCMNMMSSIKMIFKIGYDVCLTVCNSPLVE